jgi:hypothetical protein
MIDHYVLCSSQDHIGIGTRNLYHSVLAVAVSRPKISILECEPFFKSNSNFPKDFIYFHLK